MSKISILLYAIHWLRAESVYIHKANKVHSQWRLHYSGDDACVNAYPFSLILQLAFTDLPKHSHSHSQAHASANCHSQIERSYRETVWTSLKGANSFTDRDPLLLCRYLDMWRDSLARERDARSRPLCSECVEIADDRAKDVYKLLCSSRGRE